jgi:hypothetical protein
VPKKESKWRICVDYRELNKEKLKDYLLMPFIDQVLDTLVGKKYFSFLDSFSGYNQIQIAPEDQEKTTLHVHGGNFPIEFYHFGFCNAPTTFKRVVLVIFDDLIHECVEIYIDDFFVYGDSFSKALHNLEKVLIRCKESNVSFSHKNVRCCQKNAFFLGIMSLLHVLKWTRLRLRSSWTFFHPIHQRR